MWGLSLGLGGLFFVVLQFLVRAGWSVVVRRVAENIMITLPLFAVLFIPVALGLSDTHAHWWDVEVGVDPLLDAKRPYLNKSFFYLRAIVYLLVWVSLSRYFYNWSKKQDETGDSEITYRLQGTSAVAVVLFGFSVTFAAIDWLKSMDPHWYSTMWGVYYFAGCLIAIFSSMTLAILGLQRQGYIQKVINEEHYHDLGKLLFGFNVFWTYIAFSQYFLIWYANIPEEQLWFDHRSHGGWKEFAMFLAVGHFFIPFFYLLPRATKRNATTLFVGAAWMLFIHYIDMYFIVMPQFSPTVSPSIVDLLALVGVGSLFFAAFSYATVRGNLLPMKDPRLGESLAFENI
ncbi:MAG: quinol:cytochrome C oxidoreductase [Myxococcota bacterium]